MAQSGITKNRKNLELELDYFSSDFQGALYKGGD